MINSKHLIKVGAAWTSIVYVICFVGVALFPSIRILFMRYVLHADVAFGQDYISIGYFFSGLIIWNILAALGLWLFAALFNGIKR